MIKKIVLGLFAGAVCGLFASGGGMIMVPSLVYMFKLDEASARATSLFGMLPMVIASSFFYYNSNYIDWNVATKCAIGGVIGGIIGVKLLKKLPEWVLKLTFVILLIYVSIRMIVG